MDDVPNTLLVTSGNCTGTYIRVEDVNSKSSWASDTYTILFEDNDWVIKDNNGNVEHVSANWPNVEVVK